MEGRPSAARSIYRGLLEKAPVSPDSYRALAGLLRTETDLPALLRSVRAFRTRSRADPLPPALAVDLAGLFELAGSPEEALALTAAMGSGAGAAGAVRTAAALRLEMNDLQGAETALAASAGAGTEAGLRARLLLARGDLDGARAAFASAGPTLEGLEGLYEVAAARGDPEEKERAAAALSAAFPLSPEALMALSETRPGPSSGRVLPSLEPGRFLPPPPSAETPPTEQASGPAPVRLFSVQAGSFGMRENADDMIRELAERGFSPIVRESAAGGKTLFKVIVASRVDAAAADAAAARLRGMGLEPFVFSEAP